MRAVVITRPGPPDVLVLKDVPSPTPQRYEARIRVRATAVNRADILQRLGHYPPPSDVPADIPGLEYAGEVDAVGEGVEGLSVGDRVFGLAGGGTYAEQLIVPAATVVKLPETLSFAHAAAIPEAFVTAYDAMVVQARLKAGETVLISAAGSGVGTAAVQIARAIGASVIGTARTAEKLEKARRLGLREAIVTSDAKFASQVLKRTGGHGVDVVLELVGGPYVAEDVACLAERGRLLLVGLLAGVRADLDLGVVMKKRLEIRGTMLRSRPLEQKIEAANVLRRNLVPLFARGALEAVVDKIFPIEQVAAAHAYVTSNDGFGKVVLTIP